MFVVSRNHRCVDVDDIYRNIFPHQEVVGDRAEFLVVRDRQTNQGVAYDGQHADDELQGDVTAFEKGLVSIRHLGRAAGSHIHDEREREIPQSWKTWK